MAEEKLRLELASYPLEVLETEAFRTTQLNQEPIAPSTRGGRWMPPDDRPVLYASLSEDGAIAETAFRLAQLTPLPRKPLALHKLFVRRKRVITLTYSDILRLGVHPDHYKDLKYVFTQRIGQAAASIGADGLVVPSARWNCDNVVLFDDTLDDTSMRVVQTTQIDW